MKKYIVIFALALVLVMPVSAHAALFVGHQEYASSPQDRVNGNLYVGAGTSSVGATILGDLVIGGGNVSITGTVEDDVLAAGGTVNIVGTVHGDLRVAGGQVLISGHVNGDVVVAGGTVHVLSGAILDSGISVAGGQVLIDGTVHGPTKAYGGALSINGSVDDVWARTNKRLALGSGAVVHGALTYRAPRALSRADGARVDGAIVFTPMMRSFDGASAAPKAFAWILIGIITAAMGLAMIGFAALCIWRWRREVLSVIEEGAGMFWKSVLFGIAYGILVPLLIVILFVSVLGAIPAVLLGLGYVALMILSKAIAGIFLGAWLAAKMQKRTTLQISWVNGLGGVILLGVIQIIPVVGWIIKALLELSIFGVLAGRVQRRLQ